MAIYQIDATLLKECYEQAYMNLNSEMELINGLNVFPVPDGDTGTNMGLTLKAAIDHLESKELNEPRDVAKAIAKGALMGARGNSGVILSQILGGFAQGISESEILNPQVFVNGLVGAVEKSYKAVIKPIEGTMLSVIRLTAEAMSTYDLHEIDFEQFFDHLLLESNKALEETPNMLPILKESGVVDAGGRGLTSIFKGFQKAVLGEGVAFVKEPIKVTEEVEYHQSAADIEFHYCTEFIINQVHGDTQQLKQFINSLGDSMVFVEDDDLVKVHVHTNHPGEALEKALLHGSILSVKIENMVNQNAAILENHEHHHNHNTEEANNLLTEHGLHQGEEKEVGVIAVAAGEGFKDIFKDFGVDEVVLGGQTMNPSTEDLHAAASRIHAKRIIVLPNNGNIIMAANQLKDVLDKPVDVIETKTIPQGITAMMHFDPFTDYDDMLQAMKDSLSSVRTLNITYSVRNTKLNGFAIKEKDVLGILDGTIVAVDKTPEKVLRKVIEQESETTELITIYVGEDGERRKAEKVANDLMKRHDMIEIEVYEGSQPVYYYIVSLE